MATAQELLDDSSWRLKNSAWIAGTLFCCCFSWASFLYVGISAKRRSWLIAAAGYGACNSRLYGIDRIGAGDF